MLKHLRKSALLCLPLLMLMTISTPPLLAQDEAEETAKPAKVPTTYIELRPAFVANYGGLPQGRMRYIKADISLRVEAGGERAVMHHMPAIRDALLMLLSRQTEDTVSTTSGKEMIRLEALDAVREVILAEEDEHKIRDLLFNSFIVQR